VAVLAEFRRKAEETRQLHASSPGAGEGNCRRFVVIDTSHSELKVSAVPRRALTFLSVVFRGMGIHGLLELILLAVPAEHDNQYVSVLFMEEGVRTVKEDVLRLAAGIHLLDGSFSAGRAAVRQGSRAAVLPCVRAAVRPGSRAAVLSCGRAVVWPGSRAAVLSCGRAALLSCGRAAVRPCCRAAGQPCGRAVVRPGSRAAGRPCTQRLKLGIHCNKTKGCCGGGGGGGGGPAASGSGCPAAGVRGGGGGSAGRSRQRRARRDRLLRDRPRCRRRRTLLGEETSR